MKPKISVISASFNEAENLNSLVSELVKVLKKLKTTFEIIIIDDGSTDNTQAILIKLKSKISSLKIIQLRRNFGQSAALDAGLKHASGEILITMDADGQNDPQDIPKMLEKLKKDQVDCVCGWRFKRRDGFSKRFISKGALIIGNLLVNSGVHDSGCTLRVYKKECFDDLTLFGEMHRMIPALLRWRGFKLSETKVNHRPRQHGQTKYNWKRIINGFADMINTWFWRKYSSRPMHIFGLIGFILVILGSLLLLSLAYARYFLAYPLAESIWPLVGFFLCFTGIQFFVFGILANLIVQNRGGEFYLVKKIIK